MHEYYWARLCLRAESRSGRKATNKFESLSSQSPIAADIKWTVHQNAPQQSINDQWSCKYGHWKVIWSLLYITYILAASICKTDSDMVNALFSKWATTEREMILAVHLGLPKWRLVENIHKWSICCLLWQKQWRHTPCAILKMRVNGASMIFDVASW